MKKENITIELLKHHELNLFQEFIRKNLSAKHIFAMDHKIFDWQHKETSAYFCMSAKQGGELIGTHGFIPLSHFDEALPKNQIFLALWIVKEGISIGLGLRLYKEITKKYSPVFIGTTGFDQRTRDFHRWQGFDVGTMDHHFVLSPHVKKFQIAKVPIEQIPKKTIPLRRISFKKVNEQDLQTLNTSNLYLHQIPMKSDIYIKNRFIDHPEYTYDIYAIMEDGRLMALCVFRPILHEGVTVLRFVDFMGPNEAFCLLSDFIFSMLEEYDAEYLDLYSHGIPSEILMQAGFINRNTVQGLIIPNYFEPFEQKNINLAFGYKTLLSHTPVRLFKADGDQDRPNYAL